MSCLQNPIQTILGTECIGDSLPKINTNFSVLGTNVCDLLTKLDELSATPFNVQDSSAVDLNWDASTRTLSADVNVVGLDLAINPAAAKAWVIFSGITTSIESSFNVSSITDNGGIGLYTVNFASGTMSNANYFVTGIAEDVNPLDYGPAVVYVHPSFTRTSSQCQIATTGASDNTTYDCPRIGLVFFGN